MRRKTFISILIVIALLIPGLLGQLYAEKSFLWKVESDKGNGYLLGSIHLLKKEHYPLRQVIEDAFADSDTMLVEADISDPETMKLGMQLIQKGTYRADETLKDNISEKTYRLAREKLKKMGFDIEHYKKFKPWMAALTILNFQLLKLGFDPQYGIDMYFMKKAAGKKEIMELEGIEFQLKLFENFSNEESEKFFLSSVLEADQLGKEMDRMIKSWVNGDVETLAGLLRENVDKFPELKDLYEKMIDGRHVGMVDKIVNYLGQGKKCFVVVGAAHMVGKKGIVQLLKDKGYTVTQL
jgi:uncharacterized protein YbaP (TraB family)